MAVSLYLLKPIATSDLDLVTYWSVISLATQAPFTIYFYIISRKYFHSSMNISSVIKYIGASIASFSIVYILLNNYLNYKRSIFDFIPNLLLFALIGIGLYLLITITIDLRSRKLFQSIISELKNR